MHRFILAAICSFLLSASPASAALETTIRLTFASHGTIVDSFSTIYGGVAGASSSPAFNIYGGPDITPGATVFGAVSTPEFYTDAYFFMGVTDDLAAAGPGVPRQLILGANQSLAGQSFATLFPAYEEESLIAAIVGLNAGTVPYFGDEYKLVSGFQVEHGSKYAFSLSGTGYLTAFSSGQDFGTITTWPTSVNVPDALPEPVTWIMMIIGIGATGALARRQHTVVPQALGPLAEQRGLAAPHAYS